MASGLSILLPKIRIGTLDIVSSVISACVQDRRRAKFEEKHFVEALWPPRAIFWCYGTPVEEESLQKGFAEAAPI